MPAQRPVINDVTQLNPVEVWAVATPTSIEEVRDAILRSTGPISIGGGRFSMGGQTASPGSLHLDMRKLNQVVAFSPLNRTIRVQPGIRWCDIQKFVDPHGFAVKIMQTYANFTVGGLAQRQRARPVRGSRSADSVGAFDQAGDDERRAGGGKPGAERPRSSTARSAATAASA